MAEKYEDSSPSESTSTPSQSEEKSSNWWDSWISSAKTKSAEVYTMVKKDLDEIGSAVKSEASHVLNTTSNVLGKTLKLDVPESPANVMKKSFSTFIGQVSTVLNPEPDDEDDTEIILSSGDTTTLSIYKKELEGLQRVDATFIVPAHSAEFDAWLSSQESPDSIVAPNLCFRRLETSPLLKAQYEKLVPDACSHVDFWQRYLFRVALLQDRLAAVARRQPQAEPTADPVLAHLPLQSTPEQMSPLKVPSELESESNDNSEITEIAEMDNVVAWEDEDFAGDVELTEEQQILLLEEYEKEITSKKTKNTPKDVENNNTPNQAKKQVNTTTQAKKQANTTTQANAQNQTNVKAKTKTAQTNNKKKGKKPAKTDVCGNNLVEDYFADKEKEIKDDASANSDESWEKFDDVIEQKA